MVPDPDDPDVSAKFTSKPGGNNNEKFARTAEIHCSWPTQDERDERP
jgi:hypothetical protein